MSDWTIILRSLRARLFSTVTTVITVAVAVALMLVLLTMRDAGRRAFERAGGNAHLLVSRDASPLVSVLNGLFYANAPRNYIMWAEYQQFARVNEPVLAWSVPFQLGDSYQARWPVLATTPEFFSSYKPDATEGWTFAQGRAFDKDFEVVLGSQTARESGLKIGERVALTHGFPSRDAGAPAAHIHEEFQYEVVGILAATGLAHDRALFTSLGSTWIIHTHDRLEEAERQESGHEETPEDHTAEAPTTAADITDADRKITDVLLRVRTREGSDASAALPVLFDRLRKGQVFPGVTVAQPNEELRKLAAIVSNVDLILLAVAGVVMVSSGIAIMLALYNSMEQRRRQIAVLRVLGASRSRIFGLVVTESALIGVMGAAAGVALAAVGAVVTAAVVREQLGGLVISSRLAPQFVVAVAVGTVVLAALAGVVPAAAGYRTSVMRNLRPLG